MNEGKKKVFHYYFPSGEQFGNDIVFDAYQLYILYPDGSATHSKLIFDYNPWPNFTQEEVCFDWVEQRTR